MEKIIDFIIESINAGRERLKMPIVTFYITLLGLYHWKALAILFFGGIPMMDKIEKISALYPDFKTCPEYYVINTVVILLVSVFFMLLFPIIMWLSEKVLIDVSIRRKEKREKEIEADRKQQIAEVQHQFTLKEEETGNLEKSGYLDEIKSLKDSVTTHLEEKNKLQKEQQKQLVDERKRQEEAIRDLKLGFESVEDKYKAQIEELKRQVSVVQRNVIEDIIEGGDGLTRVMDKFKIMSINESYRELRERERIVIKSVLRDIIYSRRQSTIRKIGKSDTFLRILRLLEELEVIKVESQSENDITIIPNPDRVGKIRLIEG